MKISMNLNLKSLFCEYVVFMFSLTICTARFRRPVRYLVESENLQTQR